MLTNAMAAALPLKYNERGTYNHALTRSWPEDKSHKNTSAQTVVNFLAHNAWPGEIIRGHIEYDVALSTFLVENVIPQVLIIRRPIDVFLSLANWWERHCEIPVSAFLTFKQIDSPEERLHFLMTGKHNDAAVWPDFVARYEAFVGWLNCKHTLVIRYEDLLKNPEQVATQIESYLPVKMDSKKFVQALANKENRTFTLPEDKVFKQLPENLLQAYQGLGGATLETKLGY